MRMPLGSRWVAYFSPLMTMVWPALWPPLVRTTKSIGSVVASRSVALPLPSSPHWAPSTTIAGISALLVVMSAETETAPAQVHRSSCGTVAHRGRSRGRRRLVAQRVGLVSATCAPCSSSPMPTPAPPTRRRLAAALAVLREKASVEVAKTSNPGELDGVLHRAGGRTVVVAGGDGSLHAVVDGAAQAPRARPARPWPSCRWAPATTSPAATTSRSRSRKPPGSCSTGEPRKVDLHRRRDRQHRGQQRARRRRRAGQPQGRASGRPGSARSASARSTSASSATPSAPLLSAFHPPSWRLRVELDGEVVNDVDRPVLMVAIGNGGNVGGGTELNPDADTEDGRLDVMISRAVKPTAKLGYVMRLRKGEHDERDDVRHAARHDGEGERRRVLAVGRRRDLRPRAQPQLAPRAGGVHDDPAADRAAVRASRAGPPRRPPGSGCRRRARSSAPRCGAGRCAGRCRACGRSPRRSSPAISCSSRNCRPSGLTSPGLELGHRRGAGPTATRTTSSATATIERCRTCTRGSSAKPSGSGSTAWVSPKMNIRVRTSEMTRTCSPSPARTRSASGASVSARAG